MHISFTSEPAHFSPKPRRRQILRQKEPPGTGLTKVLSYLTQFACFSESLDLCTELNQIAALGLINGINSSSRAKHSSHICRDLVGYLPCVRQS